MTKDYDLNELVGGTVASIQEKFGDLSDGQLTALHDLENARDGGGRTTLLNAIHVETDHRAEAARALADAPKTMLASELANTADTEAQAAAEGGVPPAGADAPAALGAADGTAPDTLAAERAGESTGAASPYSDAGPGAEAQLEYLATGLEKLGYSRDGGPEDATIVDKALFALAGVSADRDQLKDDLIGKPGAIYTQAEVDAQLKARDDDWQAKLDAAAPEANDADKPATFTKEEVDRMLEERDGVHAEDKKQAVAAAKAGAVPKPAKTKVGKPMAIADGADHPMVALTGESQVVFVDSDDVPIDTLPRLSFGASDYRPSGESITLKRDVEFPTAVAETEVAAAFLLSGDTPVGKARLVVPFGIGGGRQARLPEGTLAFERAGAPTPKPATFGAV